MHVLKESPFFTTTFDFIKITLCDILGNILPLKTYF